MALKDELDYNLSLARLHLGQQIAKYACIAGVAWIFCRYAYYAVHELAGRATNADIAVRLLLALHTSKGVALALSWLVSSAAVGGWALERNGRKRLIERFHPEKRKKQMQLDPKKRSSGITLRGETRPGDL